MNKHAIPDHRSTQETSGTLELEFPLYALSFESRPLLYEDRGKSGALTDLPKCFEAAHLPIYETSESPEYLVKLMQDEDPSNPCAKVVKLKSAKCVLKFIKKCDPELRTVSLILRNKKRYAFERNRFQAEAERACKRKFTRWW